VSYYVGVTGTHSTGKSTFLDAVREALTARGFSVAGVSDQATHCQEAGFGILRDHTFESTLWIMCSVIRAELEAGLKAEVVLVDRPVQDALGYLEAALVAQGRVIAAHERHYLYKLASLHGQRYTLLFKTTLDPSVVVPPDRDSDLAFRVLVDEKITKVLLDGGTRHETLGRGEVEAGVKSVLQAVAGGIR
jgi:hypothetical protein